MTTINESVGFIGFGMMGQALAGGLLDKGVVKPGNLFAADPYTKFESVPFVEKYQVHCTRDNVEAIAKSDIVILAVKPFLLDGLLQKLKDAKVSLAGKLIVSLVSAFTLDRLAKFNMGTKRIVRIMPNTPCLYGEGATAVCALPDVDPKDTETVRQMLSTIGKAWIIPENRMNVWTAAAGAGPAYVFLFMEAIADAAVAGGIPRDVANEMAAQLVYGSANMAIQSKQHFSQLKDNVCSPAGVTIAGVQKLHENAFSGIVMSSISRARERYDEVEKDPNA